MSMELRVNEYVMCNIKYMKLLLKGIFFLIKMSCDKNNTNILKNISY